MIAEGEVKLRSLTHEPLSSGVSVLKIDCLSAVDQAYEPHQLPGNPTVYNK